MALSQLAQGADTQEGFSTVSDELSVQPVRFTGFKIQSFTFLSLLLLTDLDAGQSQEVFLSLHRAF